MLKVEIYGISNHRVIPLAINVDNQIATTSGISSNNGDNSKTAYTALLLGEYRNQLTPVLVDSEGRLIV